LFGFRKINAPAARFLDLPWHNSSGVTYGLQMVLPPQFVLLPPPPSALTTVGTTRVLRNSMVAPRTS